MRTAFYHMTRLFGRPESLLKNPDVLERFGRLLKRILIRLQVRMYAVRIIELYLLYTTAAVQAAVAHTGASGADRAEQEAAFVPSLAYRTNMFKCLTVKWSHGLPPAGREASSTKKADATGGLLSGLENHPRSSELSWQQLEVSYGPGSCSAVTISVLRKLVTFLGGVDIAACITDPGLRPNAVASQ